MNIPRLLYLNPAIRRSLGRSLSQKLITTHVKSISPRAKLAFSAKLIANIQNITIGDGSVIGFDTELHAWGQITIGKNVIISPHTLILTGTHDIANTEYDPLIKPVTIEDYVWIAMRCIILPGVTIGRGAVVGAGSVVTKNVEPRAIVAGNPAKKIGVRPDRDLTYIPADW